MKRLVPLLIVGLVFGASSCDDGTPEPPGEPPGGGAWALTDCPSESGAAFLFIGLDQIACHHDGRTYTDGLDSLQFPSSGDVYFQSDVEDKLMVLSNDRGSRAAYRLHLPTGSMARLSVPGTRGSQINEMSPGRFLITDVRLPPPGSSTVTLTYTAYQSRALTRLSEIPIENVGDLVPIRSDYDAASNTVVHAFLSQTLSDYLVVVVDLNTTTSRVVRLNKALVPSSIQRLVDGNIIVSDQFIGKVYRLEDDNRFVEVASIGPRHDDVTGRLLLPYDDERAVTFTTDGVSTRILTVDAAGTVETLGTVDQVTRYMSVDGKSTCGTELSVYSTSGGVTYDERVWQRSTDGTVLQQTVTLSREKFQDPFVACF